MASSPAPVPSIDHKDIVDVGFVEPVPAGPTKVLVDFVSQPADVVANAVRRFPAQRIEVVFGHQVSGIGTVCRVSFLNAPVVRRPYNKKGTTCSIGPHA